MRREGAVASTKIGSLPMKGLLWLGRLVAFPQIKIPPACDDHCMK